jgi:hypothetical protein
MPICFGFVLLGRSVWGACTASLLCVAAGWLLSSRQTGAQLQCRRAAQQAASLHSRCGVFLLFGGARGHAAADGSPDSCRLLIGHWPTGCVWGGYEAGERGHVCVPLFDTASCDAMFVIRSCLRPGCALLLSSSAQGPPPARRGAHPFLFSSAGPQGAELHLLTVPCAARARRHTCARCAGGLRQRTGRATGGARTMALISCRARRAAACGLRPAKAPMTPHRQRKLLRLVVRRCVLMFNHVYNG